VWVSSHPSHFTPGASTSDYSLAGIVLSLSISSCLLTMKEASVRTWKKYHTDRMSRFLYYYWPYANYLNSLGFHLFIYTLEIKSDLPISVTVKKMWDKTKAGRIILAENIVRIFSSSKNLSSTLTDAFEPQITRNFYNYKHKTL
jgi:hypothetical protein